MAALLISRLYTLQIVNSERYLSDFQSRIRRTVVIHGTRARILDKNGNVLADSVASANITMNDLTDGSKEDWKKQRRRSSMTLPTGSGSVLPSQRTKTAKKKTGRLFWRW